MATTIPIDLLAAVDAMCRTALAGRVPLPSDDPEDAECRTDGATLDGLTVTFTPALTAPESLTFHDIIQSARYGLPLATYQARKDDIATVKAAMSGATTHAELVLAFRALVRVYLADRDD